MPLLSRRALLGAAAAVPAAASQAARTNFRQRVHPLEGIPRENLKVTDVKVTLMSYELPKDKLVAAYCT